MVKKIKGMKYREDRPLYIIRPAAKFIKKLLGKDLVGVEVGVFKGQNARAMLELMDLKLLYLVDRYEMYEDYKLSYLSELDTVKAMAFKLVDKFKEKIEWILKDSREAYKEIPDGLDFVYIDGNHTYEFVKADIENFWPKIRNGGVLAGHDYNDLNKKPGVKKGVDEFVKNNALKLHRGKTDWWVIKD